MFKVLTKERKQIDILESPISPVITAELGGIGELTFSVPSTYKHLELEGYIQVENDHEYVIKEIVTHGTNREVVCMLNIEEIVGMAWSTFISKDQNVYKTALQILNGTGWRVVNNSTTKETRNLYGKATNSYNLLQLMCTVFDVEFTFDTYEKTVYIVDRVGNDCGTYFINDLNLKQLNIDTHTHKYITRVIPIGKDGLQITSVNDGRNYLENKTYCDKNIYGIWQSDKHDDPAKLKADAQRFLDEMAVPYETYEVLVDDLYALKGYDEFRYNLGDVVTIIDGVTETKIKQRVIQRTYNLQEPDKDTIHIANKDKSFEDYYKRLQTIADMTESVIGSDGTISGGNLADGSVSGDKLETGIINADHIQAGSITADHIQANQIFTEHLVANSITAELIQANSIDTKHLKANSITADHIQTGAISAGSGIIADGAIGDAQIANLNAGKIKSGRLDTSLVTIQSGSGNMLMSDNTIQINDDKGTTRVQIGKDARDDYNMYVCDADGQVMFDATGITAKGIKSPIIRDDMISEDAHINGAKIDIESVITRINDSETLIKTSKIAFDDTGQTLQVAFKELCDTVDQVDQDFTHFKNTELNAIQGKISTLIQDTTIEKDGESYKIKDLYSSLEQTTEGIKTTVGKKVDKDSIISTINQSAEAVTIDASKISLRGVVTADSLAGNGTTTINGANIMTGTLSVDSLKSNNANPIIKLFPTTASDGTRGYCSLDATKQYEQGVGTAIRLKWDSMNYLLQRKSGVEYYMEPREQGASFNFQSDYGHHTSNYESRIVTKDGTLCFRRSSNSDENTSSLYFYTGSNNYDRKLLTSYDLSSSVSSTTTQGVATPYAVKQAYDKAVSAYNVGNHSHPYAPSSHSHSGSSWESLSLNKGYINYLYYVNGSTTDWSVLSTAHLSPNTTNRYLGQSGSSRRWQSAFLVSSPNVSSDATLKENIEYLDDNSKTRRKGLLTANQLHDFIKNDLRIAEYDYKIDAQSLNECCEDEQKLIRSMNNHQIGFIAQDIVDTEVGAKIVTEDSDGILGYETGNFMAVIAGALQEEIKRREELEAKCAYLENRLAKIEELIGGM